jgi:hypothetical protein
MGNSSSRPPVDRQVQPGETTPQNRKHSRLIPLAKWPNYHEWPPVGGLRYLVFHEKTNGFDHCVVRIGRRVLIDEDSFFEWAESHRPPPSLPRR